MGNETAAKEPVSITKKIDVTVVIEAHDASLCSKQCKFVCIYFNEAGFLSELCHLFSTDLVETQRVTAGELTCCINRCKKCLEAFGTSQ